MLDWLATGQLSPSILLLQLVYKIDLALSVRIRKICHLFEFRHCVSSLWFYFKDKWCQVLPHQTSKAVQISWNLAKYIKSRRHNMSLVSNVLHVAERRKTRDFHVVGVIYLLLTPCRSAKNGDGCIL